MIIQADLESMKRMLQVSDETRIPEAVLAEYQLRLHLFHCDGHSGPLGSVGVIDMLRSMSLGRRPTIHTPLDVDWSRMPKDGSLRVEAMMPGKSKDRGKDDEWRPGVFLGLVGVGALAIRLDGSIFVHEMRRMDVRIARAAKEEADDPQSDTPQAVQIPEPWSDASLDSRVWVDDEGDYKDGAFCGYADGEVLVRVDGDGVVRRFPESRVTFADAASATKT